MCMYDVCESANSALQSAECRVRVQSVHAHSHAHMQHYATSNMQASWSVIRVPIPSQFPTSPIQSPKPKPPAVDPGVECGMRTTSLQSQQTQNENGGRHLPFFQLASCLLMFFCYYPSYSVWIISLVRQTEPRLSSKTLYTEK